MAKPDINKRDLVLQKWQEYQEVQAKNGKPVVQTDFINSTKGTKWETNISSFRNYTGKNAPRSKAAAQAQQLINNSPNQSGLLATIEQEFNRYYEEQRPAAFAQYLKERQEEIRQKIVADAEKQLQEAISKLTQSKGD